MSSGVSRTTPTQPSQQSGQVQTDRPRDPDTASKFKESLQSSKSDAADVVGKGSDTMPRMEEGLRGQEMRHQFRDQGRVDSDGGRGRQGQGQSDEKGGRDSQSQAKHSAKTLDPRLAPPPKQGPLQPGMKKPGLLPGAKGKGQALPGKAGELARGMVKTGTMKKQPPGSSVRGTSPFGAGKPLGSILGQKGAPTLRQTRAVGSRGFPAHRLQPEPGLRDPRFRAGLTSFDNAPKRTGRPLRTPPPSAGAPLIDAGEKKGEKMPEISVQGHSSPGPPVDRLDDGLRVDREAAERAKELREKEQKVVEAPPPKPQVELQPRVIEAKQVQSTQKMTQAEIAEIVRKVESMVSKVRLETTALGNKQMSLTVSDGRLKGVEINVTVDKSGKVNAEFKAENVDARNLLSENIKELEKSMKDKGLEVNKLEIGSEAAGRRDFASQQEQQRKHESAQAQLGGMDGGGDGGQGQAQPARDPRMAGPKPAGARPGAGVPGAVPTAGTAVPTGQGPETSNYVA
jgi:hypothetical protein